MKLNDTAVERLARMQGHPLWDELSVKQKKFVEHFALSGCRNKIASVTAAFECDGANSARSIASTLLKRYQIRTLLAEFFEYSDDRVPVSRKELMHLISQRLRKDPTVREFHQLTLIYIELQGWRERWGSNAKAIPQDAAPEELSPKDNIIKLVQQYEREQRYEKVEED